MATALGWWRRWLRELRTDASDDDIDDTDDDTEVVDDPSECIDDLVMDDFEADDPDDVDVRADDAEERDVTEEDEDIDESDAERLGAHAPTPPQTEWPLGVSLFPSSGTVTSTR